MYVEVKSVTLAEPLDPQHLTRQPQEVEQEKNQQQQQQRQAVGQQQQQEQEHRQQQEQQQGDNRTFPQHPLNSSMARHDESGQQQQNQKQKLKHEQLSSAGALPDAALTSAQPETAAAEAVVTGSMGPPPCIALFPDTVSERAQRHVQVRALGLGLGLTHTSPMFLQRSAGGLE